MIEKQPSQYNTLLKHCQWLIELRWFAGISVIAGTLADTWQLHWYHQTTGMLIIGIMIFLHNIFLCSLMRQPGMRNSDTIFLQVWAQILPDLGILTVLTLWTGAAHSPLLGFYVFHMVFASLLLSRQVAYGVAATALAMFAIGLGIAGDLPKTLEEKLVILGWSLTLFLTVYLANYITENLKREQATLRHQHQLMQAILNAAADAIITINPQSQIQLFNPAAEHLFGYTTDEASKKPFSIIIPKRFQSEAFYGMAHWIGKDPLALAGTTLELIARHKNGDEFPIGLTYGIWSDDEYEYLTCIIRDITTRKQTESEIRELNHKLKTQQQAMIQHEKMVAVGQMVAGVSHEITNPLASMDSILQLVERRPEKMTTERVTLLRQQVERIQRTIGHMTDFSHPTELKWQEVSVDELVATALFTVRFDRRQNNITIEQQLQHPSCNVRVQPHAIQQAFVNLLINAFDAVADRESPHLIISSKRGVDACSISFTDNGCGMHEEQYQSIFEPFFTTKPVGKGTGLGLAICQDLITKQGGTIEVASKLDQGTVFTITLPLAANQTSKQRDTKPTSDAS